MVQNGRTEIRDDYQINYIFLINEILIKHDENSITTRLISNA